MATMYNKVTISFLTVVGRNSLDQDHWFRTCYGVSLVCQASATQKSQSSLPGRTPCLIIVPKAWSPPATQHRCFSLSVESLCKSAKDVSHRLAGLAISVLHCALPLYHHLRHHVVVGDLAKYCKLSAFGEVFDLC